MARQGSPSEGYTVASYFSLADAGLLAEDDRVELLDGLIVAMPPQSPRHASAISRLARALSAAVGDRAVVRIQCPLIAGQRSVPEPDAAIVAGSLEDYDRVHPREALLAVEVAEATLPQNRLTKTRIYAGAGVIEYWIVNLRDEIVEVHRDPDVGRRVYRATCVARRGDDISLVALPDVALAVAELLPKKHAERGDL